MRVTPLAKIWLAKCDNKEELVTSVDAFRPKKDHKAVPLLEEWALQILEPDPHILKWAKKVDGKTKERHNKAKKVDGDKFKFTKQNLATNVKEQPQQKYDELVTDAKRNQSKGKPELVQIINTAIGDVLVKLKIKKAGKKKSKKIVAEMKIMYDPALAMTLHVNKGFRKTYTDFYKMRNGMENELSNKRKWVTDDKEDEETSESEDDEKSDVNNNNDEESSASKQDTGED